MDGTILEDNVAKLMALATPGCSWPPTVSGADAVWGPHDVGENVDKSLEENDLMTDSELDVTTELTADVVRHVEVLEKFKGLSAAVVAIVTVLGGGSTLCETLSE